MRQLLLAALLISQASLSNAQIFGPKTFEQCIDRVVKTSRTESATNLGIMNCRNKFRPSTGLIDDCAVTWTGKEFQKGRPANPKNYRMVIIKDTTHEIYLPSRMNDEVAESVITDNLDKIKILCPF